MMDLIAPQVTMTDVDEVIHITHEIHWTLNESNTHLNEFLQEIMKMVICVASITP